KTSKKPKSTEADASGTASKSTLSFSRDMAETAGCCPDGTWSENALNLTLPPVDESNSGGIMTSSASEAITTTPDAERIEAFEERLTRALNEAGMLLMASLGHRTGLFDSLADGAK